MSKKSTHYRLYCEYLGPVSDEFIAAWWNPNGITVTHGDGFWMGKHENSVIIDYVAHDYGDGVDPCRVVESFCKCYCEKFNQDCVLVTSTPCQWELISNDVRNEAGEV